VLLDRPQQRGHRATYRRTLAHLLQQVAQYGGVPFAPSQTANGIVEARAQMQQIKAAAQDEPDKVTH
jgi:hypothetical protein